MTKEEIITKLNVYLGISIKKSLLIAKERFESSYENYRL
jgi:hypothetical protein